MMQDATDFDLPVLLTTPEIVRLLRVDRSTMTRWRSAGTGPKVTWLVAHTPRYNQDDVLGRRKYVRGKTRGEVQREIRRLVAEAEEGRLSPDRAPTLATWLERYLNEVASTTVRPSTLHRYRQEVRLYIAPSLGKLRIDQLRPNQVAAFYQEQLRHLSAGSVRRLHALLRRALTVAVRWRIVPSNPIAAVDPPAIDAAEVPAVQRSRGVAIPVRGQRPSVRGEMDARDHARYASGRSARSGME
jgi:hypothetical protein